MRKAYPSDLTDAQWALLEPLIPVASTGRPRIVDTREVLNAIFYLARSGCQWDMLPNDLPARSTVNEDFLNWRDDGTWQHIMDALRRSERGYDGGKKLRGVKRHIIVDGMGLLLVIVVTAASADDGTAAPRALGRLTAEHRSRLAKVRADGKYRNHSLDRWLKARRVGYVIEVVARPPGSVGSVKLPSRWVVERTFAWLGRYRRNSRDYEWRPESSEAFIKVCSIHRMLRLLAPDTSKRPVSFKYRELQPIIPG